MKKFKLYSNVLVLCFCVEQPCSVTTIAIFEMDRLACACIVCQLTNITAVVLHWACALLRIFAFRCFGQYVDQFGHGFLDCDYCSGFHEHRLLVLSLLCQFCFSFTLCWTLNYKEMLKWSICFMLQYVPSIAVCKSRLACVFRNAQHEREFYSQTVFDESISLKVILNISCWV